MSHGLPGILIAIEGIDGGGKTTQVLELVRTLRLLGLSVITSKEPTDGPHGRALRSSGATGRLPLEEELALFVADRREHVERLLIPLLRQGGVVIVDRYYFSTAAYQGARGADVQAVLDLNESFAPRPDAVLILDLDVDIGQARIRARGDVANHFEDADELRRVQQVFRAMVGD